MLLVSGSADPALAVCFPNNYCIPVGAICSVESKLARGKVEHMILVLAADNKDAGCKKTLMELAWTPFCFEFDIGHIKFASYHSAFE